MSPNDKPETRCAKCGSLMFDKHRNCLMCGEKNAPTTKCACGHDWPDWAHTPTGCKPMRYNPATGEHDLAPATEGAAVRAVCDHNDRKDRDACLTCVNADNAALCAEVRRHEQRIKDYENEPGWREIVAERTERLRAEVERLKADAADWQRLRDDAWVKKVAAEAEVERLKDVMQNNVAFMAGQERCVAALMQIIEAAPHAHGCASRPERIDKQPCDCFKSKAKAEVRK